MPLSRVCVLQHCSWSWFVPCNGVVFMHQCQNYSTRLFADLETTTYMFLYRTCPTFSDMFARLSSFKGAHRPGLFQFVPNQVFIFLLGRFVLMLLYWKTGRSALSPTGLTYVLTSLPRACWLCFALCGHRQDNDNNKMSCGLTWCSEEVRCCIRAGEDISHLLDTKIVKFIKS